MKFKNSIRFWKIIGLLSLSILVLSGAGCASKSENWQGFYYPNGDFITEENYIYSQMFDNSADCMNWGSTLKLERGNSLDKWECGKNCRKETVYICEETID
ncbi:MAG: hypothetical protein WC348_00745 [Patescibacteria group bacterium]|jgi:hypothetical protein